MRLARVVGGIVGPATVIMAWAALGATTDGYSPVAEPISRLAASGSPTQVAMTAAFVVYALGVGAYASELRIALSGPAAAAAMVNAVAALGIASTPLESSLGGAPHAAAAAVTYASLAAIPLICASTLFACGRRPAAYVSIAAGIAAGTCLALSSLDADRVGLWQRAGLTLGHLWLIGSAVAIGTAEQRRNREASDQSDSSPVRSA